MADLGRVADELAVRGLVAHFADIVNRRAYDEFAAVWAPDGVWEIPGFPETVGHDAIVERLRSLLTAHEGLLQLVHSGRVWIDGDHAECRWYISELARGVDGRTRVFAGVYRDELVRLSAGWRFRRRRYDSMFRGVGDPETATFPFPSSS